MRTVTLLMLLIPSISVSLAGQELPIVAGVNFRAFGEQVTTFVKALKVLGEHLSSQEISELERLAKVEGDDGGAAEQIQKILDRHCLVGVNINPEGRVTVQQGPARAELIESGWRTFLIKVQNEAGITAALSVTSPNSNKSSGADQKYLPFLFLDIQLLNEQPLTRHLSGVEVEYRIVRLYSRESGKREAKLTFDVGHGSQDLGFRSEIDILFTAKSAGKSALP